MSEGTASKSFELIYYFVSLITVYILQNNNKMYNVNRWKCNI